MYFLSFIIAFFMATVLYLSSVECEDLNLTPFGQKIKLLLSEDAKNKLFNQNYKSPEELEKTEEILPKNFTEAIGTPLKSSRVEKVNKAITKLLQSDRKDGLFEAYTNAVTRTLKYLGKLNTSNVNQLAAKYVDELDESAMTVPDDYSLSDTFPVLVISLGRFLKSEGATEKDANQFLKYLTQELKKSTSMTVTNSSTTPKTMADDSSYAPGPVTVTDVSSTTHTLTLFSRVLRITDLLNKLKKLLKSKGLTLS